MASHSVPPPKEPTIWEDFSGWCSRAPWWKILLVPVALVLCILCSIAEWWAGMLNRAFNYIGDLMEE